MMFVYTDNLNFIHDLNYITEITFNDVKCKSVINMVRTPLAGIYICDEQFVFWEDIQYKKWCKITDCKLFVTNIKSLSHLSWVNDRVSQWVKISKIPTQEIYSKLNIFKRYPKINIWSSAWGKVVKLIGIIATNNKSNDLDEDNDIQMNNQSKSSKPQQQIQSIQSQPIQQQPISQQPIQSTQSQPIQQQPISQQV